MSLPYAIPERNKFRSTLIYLLLFFAAWIARVYVLLPVDSDIQPPELKILVYTLIRFAIWIVPLVIYLRATETEPPGNYLKLTTPINRASLPAVMFIVGLYLIGGVLVTAWTGGHVIDLRHLSPHDWLILALDVPDAPIIEEIVFRGFVLRRFTEALGFWKATILSSLLFMFIHWPGWIYASGLQPASLLWNSIQVFIFGGLLAVLVRRTNSILPGIVTHLLNNLIYR